MGCSCARRAEPDHCAESVGVLEPVAEEERTAPAASEAPSSKRAHLGNDGPVAEFPGASTSDQGPPFKRARLGASLVPTASDLASFGNVVQRLWDIDSPFRLRPGLDFRLNHQARAASLQSGCDRCKHPLFAHIDDKRLRAQDCATTFLALLDNYERSTDRAERMTKERWQEEQAFLSELVNTPHMLFAREVLSAWGLLQGSQGAFIERLRHLWFTTYSLHHGGPMSSSGFEHVFVGEEKWDKWKNRVSIIGFHNWIQFWLQERAGRVDYRGYVGLCPDGADQLVSVRFAWEDDDPEEATKSVSTFLIGTSVAFEMALYTIAFISFGGEAAIGGLCFGSLGPLKLKTFPWGTADGKVIRTAYLEKE